MSDSPEPRGLDVTVLRHLRGFPDELQRFGNIVKQVHGRGAVEFFLSQPAPADSFLAAMRQHATRARRTASAGGAGDAPPAGGG